MIRHLFRLVWNRKRSNALMIAEIFLSFLVVFAVVTLGVHFWSNYSRSLGFDYEHVWSIEILTDQPYSEEENGEEQRALSATLLREVGTMDEVVAAAFSEDMPYDGNTSLTSDDVDGRNVQTQVGHVTDDFAAVMGIEVVAGRWFGPEDDAYDTDAVMIDRDLARELFGDADPIGQITGLGWGSSGKRIVGLLADYRKQGDFANPRNFLIQRKTEEGGILHRLAIKVAPGVTAAFEEDLVRRLAAVAPRWSFEITPLMTARTRYLRATLAPLLSIGVVAGFLMLMVALGLIGVLWQNVTQRTREIGLRRATGAARRNIHRQILTELMLVTTLGLAIGTVTVIQVPMLSFIDHIRGAEYTVGLVFSLLLVYLLAGLCALYPSWLATRVQPAESLHYE